MTKTRFALGSLSLLLLGAEAAAQTTQGVAAQQGDESSATTPNEEAVAEERVSLNESLQRVTLKYDVPPECPSREGFFVRLADKDAPFQFAFHDAVGSLHIKIVAQEQEFSGSATLTLDGAASTQRTVNAPTCSEVLDTLAMMVGFELSPPHLMKQGDTTTATLAAATCKDSCDDASEDIIVGADQAGTRSHTRHPKWARGVGLHHETQSKGGRVAIDRHVAFDAQLGATFGLLPQSPLPRLDLIARTALFLTTPGDRSFLVGLIPRVRFTLHPRTNDNYEGTVVDISSYGFALGGCFSPYFDPQGFAVLGCADVGAGSVLTGTNFPDDGIGYSYKVWTTRVSASLEGEYNFASHFHAGLRIGMETHSAPNFDPLTDEDLYLYSPTGITAFATAGIGVHF